MLATDKQINYLFILAQRVELIKQANPNLTLPEYINWHTERYKGVTTYDASERIDAYRTIIRNVQLTRMLLNKPQYRFIKIQNHESK